jgi:hypothetical protein
MIEVATWFEFIEMRGNRLHSRNSPVVDFVACSFLSVPQDASRFGASKGLRTAVLTLASSFRTMRHHSEDSGEGER